MVPMDDILKDIKREVNALDISLPSPAAALTNLMKAASVKKTLAAQADQGSGPSDNPGVTEEDDNNGSNPLSLSLGQRWDRLVRGRSLGQMWDRWVSGLLLNQRRDGSAASSPEETSESPIQDVTTSLAKVSIGAQIHHNRLLDSDQNEGYTSTFGGKEKSVDNEEACPPKDREDSWFQRSSGGGCYVYQVYPRNEAGNRKERGAFRWTCCSCHGDNSYEYDAGCAHCNNHWRC